MKTIKARINAILAPAGEGDLLSRAVDLFVLILILLDLAAFIVGSIPAVDDAYRGVFSEFEHFVLAVFGVEYALRLWSCTAERRFSAPIRGRLRYMVSPMALIDLCAILPLLALLPSNELVGHLFPEELTALRSFRLMRLARLGKVARYSISVRTLGRALRSIRQELAVISIVMVLVMLVASTLLFAAEGESHPLGDFSSIPDSMWYAVVVMTTVGLGDVATVTTAGKVITAIIAMCGIAMFAVPSGLLGAAFVEEFRRQEDEGQEAEERAAACPHCGGHLGSVRPGPGAGEDGDRGDSDRGAGR
ncbi:MAG: ion transporter [Planctomycetota bacterium]|nr:ion transporter [Planctomycetota bacterium]MDP6837528.1 ion transporter [Planctomycetota bacterium]